MYRSIGILFLFFSTLGAMGQTEFCAEGARWIYYSLGSASPPSQHHYVYSGDTTINGFSDVRILEKETRIAWIDTFTQVFESTSFFRHTNDSVLHLVNGEFKFMFDFDVQPGDTRLVHLDWGCVEQDTMRIDSLGTMNYQGQQLTTYHFTLLIDDQLDSLDGEFEAYYLGGGNGMYVERIGLMANHPSNLEVICVEGGVIAEYMPANFVCYTDNELAVNFPDTCNLFLEIEEERPELQPEIIHFGRSFRILNASKSTIIICDILGKQLHHAKIQSIDHTFDINTLPNGILLVVIESENQRITKKLFKANN